MLHRVVDSLCQADEDVRVQVRINVEPVDQCLHEVFHFGYATWVGRQFQYIGFGGDVGINLSFSTIDNILRQETYNKVSGQGIQICIVRSQLHAV